MHLILASASPRRVELLAAAGFTFETLAVDVDETPHAGEPPERYVRRLAAEKSARALAEHAARLKASPYDGAEAGSAKASAERWAAGSAQASAERWACGSAKASAERIIVIGADTTVVVDDEILAKPEDDADARRMLGRLSGRTHQVLTGISLRQGAYEVGRVEKTDVEFAALSAADVEWYVETGEGRDKAGAYAIQGYAARFIPRIVGSYSNVVGLPVAAVWELLREFGDGQR